MADGTKIEWTDSTANFANGCTRVSPGCGGPGPHGGCYAERMAGSRLKTHPSREGLTRSTSAGPRWTGEVRPWWPALKQALQWQDPRMIFWNAHGDLFHDAVSDDLIDANIAACALTPQHIHQLLTKRSARMREYFHGLDREGAVGRVARFAKAMSLIYEMTGSPKCAPGKGVPFVPHPLPNLWLGVSAEDQLRWNERTADLREVGAAVQWVSCEPLLGPIVGDMRGIDWVVVGGESGPRARPMHPDWARSLRDQCASAGVAFLFKQWGEWHPMGQQLADGSVNAMDKGEHPDRWHAPTLSVRIGKVRAGRLLDGVLHDGYPNV